MKRRGFSMAVTKSRKNGSLRRVSPSLVIGLLGCIIGCLIVRELFRSRQELDQYRSMHMERVKRVSESLLKAEGGVGKNTVNQNGVVWFLDTKEGDETANGMFGGELGDGEPEGGAEGVFIETWTLTVNTTDRQVRTLCRVSPVQIKIQPSDPEGGGFDAIVVLPSALRDSDELASCDLGPHEFTDEPLPSAAEIKDVDLMSPRAHRTHFPHFATDFVNAMVAYEAEKQVSIDLRYCTGPGCSKRSLVSHGRSIIVTKVLATESSDRWVPSFLSQGRHPIDMIPMDETSGKWFNSVVLTTGWHQRMIPGLLDGNEFLSEVVDRKRSTKCPLQVTVINRNKVPNAKKKGRYFVDESKLMSELKKECKDCVINLKMLDGVPFSDQVDLFHQSDVLISVHGAELTNCLWMKRNSLLIEIPPFAYTSRLFEEMAASIGVTHHSVMAEPDPKFLEPCIEDYLKNAKDQKVAHDSVTAAMKLFSGWMTDWGPKKLKPDQWLTERNAMESAVKNAAKNLDMPKLGYCVREQPIKLKLNLITNLVKLYKQNRCGK